MKILKKAGIDRKNLIIIMNLYWRQKTVMRVDGENTEELNLLGEVRFKVF